MHIFLLTEMPYLDTNYAEENLKTISCLTSFLSVEVNIKTKSKSQQGKSKYHSGSKIIKKFSLFPEDRPIEDGSI